jgi:hypothetical protein
LQIVNVNGTLLGKRLMDTLGLLPLPRRCSTKADLSECPFLREILRHTQVIPVSERHLELRAPEKLKASVPYFRHLSEGVPEGKEIVMEGCDGERALGCLDNQRQGLIYSL